MSNWTLNNETLLKKGGNFKFLPQKIVLSRQLKIFEKTF